MLSSAEHQNFKMKKTLLLVMLLFPAFARAEWILIRTLGGGEVKVYVDPATIKRNGNVVEFSTLFDYATVRTLSGAPFRSATMQDEIDCAGKQSRTLAVTSHSETMGGGHVVSTSTGGDAPWIPIAPKTIPSATLKFVCKKKASPGSVASAEFSAGWRHLEPAAATKGM